MILNFLLEYVAFLLEYVVFPRPMAMTAAMGMAAESSPWLWPGPWIAMGLASPSPGLGQASYSPQGGHHKGIGRAI